MSQQEQQQQLTLNRPQLNPAPVNEIVIWFDGGCRPTNPGNKYGSFEVQVYGKTAISKSRFPLGWGTNNEAEFEALETALKSLLQFLSERLDRPEENRVQVFTDSTILMNRLVRGNRILKKKYAESSARMFQRAKAVLDLLNQFHSFEVWWQGRKNNVQRFGH